MVGNLLSNALKFTPKGGSITVSLKQESKHITLSVSDTGQGMSQEEQNHILEPFYTSKSKENPHGTGVGLALVNEIVKATGGSIAWKSAPGEGTTFCISIPIQHRGKPISESEMYSEPAPTDIELDDEAPKTINEGQSLKQILIVEDNSDVASFIGSQLGKDYEIHFAQNGKEGLDMARSLIPDLIISDVMMPMMDGLEFCRLLRADELVCHIPVIMVTAKVSEEDRLRGLECGVDASAEIQTGICTAAHQRRHAAGPLHEACQSSHTGGRKGRKGPECSLSGRAAGHQHTPAAPQGDGTHRRYSCGAHTHYQDRAGTTHSHPRPFGPDEERGYRLRIHRLLPLRKGVQERHRQDSIRLRKGHVTPPGGRKTEAEAGREKTRSH